MIIYRGSQLFICKHIKKNLIEFSFFIIPVFPWAVQPGKLRVAPLVFLTF